VYSENSILVLWAYVADKVKTSIRKVNNDLVIGFKIFREDDIKTDKRPDFLYEESSSLA
jgi:hypothetical protein